MKSILILLLVATLLCCSNANGKLSLGGVMKGQWTGLTSNIWSFFTDPNSTKCDDFPAEILYNMISNFDLDTLSKPIASLMHMKEINTMRDGLLTTLAKCKKDVPKNAAELKKNVEAFIKVCTPDVSAKASQLLNAVRITIFWKVIATLRLSNKFFFPNLECILGDALDDYVKKELEKNDNKFLKHYVTGLTPFEHTCISEYLMYLPMSSKLITAYVLYLEPSIDHLKGRVDFWTLSSINGNIIGANAQCMVYDNTKPKVTDNLKINLRFKLLNGFGSNIQNLDVVKSLHLLLRNNVAAMKKNDQVDRVFFAAVFCGVQELLTEKNFNELVYKARINLAIFEVAAKKDPFIKLLSDSLKASCMKSETHNTELQLQLKQINQFTGTANVSNTNNFFNLVELVIDQMSRNKYLLQTDEIQSYMALIAPNESMVAGKLQTFRNGLLETIKKKTKALASATDIKDYTEMLKFIRNLDTVLDTEAYQKIYLTYFTIVTIQPKSSDLQKSFEFNRLHSETFENMLEDIRTEKSANLFDFKGLLTTLLKQHESLFNFKDSTRDINETKLTQQLILKNALTLGNEVYGMNFEALNSDSASEKETRLESMDTIIAHIQITTIVEFAFKLVSLRGEEMWRNHCLVDEFVWFMLMLPDEIKRNIVYSTHDAFSLVHQQVQTRPDLKNPMVFLCQFLFLQLRKRVTMMPIPATDTKKKLPEDFAMSNILYFEKELHPIIDDRVFRKHIFPFCIEFYVRQSDQLMGEMISESKVFVNRLLDYVSTALIMDLSGYAEVLVSLMEIVYDIIDKDPHSRRNLTPDQTISKVQQVSFLCRNTFTEIFDKKLRQKFSKCKGKLGFTDELKIEFF